MRQEANALRIGAELKRRRVALGISQADLATQSGMTRAGYEMLETGEWPARTPADSRAAMLGAVVCALESQSGDVRVDGPLVRSVA